MPDSVSTRTSSDAIIIDCPIPPSLNRLWRFGKGRMYKSGAYNRWMWEFAYHVHKRHRSTAPIIPGSFDAEILIAPRHKRDADNNAKALLDACQALLIIRNDSDARKVTQEIVDSDRAPLGCRLTLTPLEDTHATAT